MTSIEVSQRAVMKCLTSQQFSSSECLNDKLIEFFQVCSICTNLEFKGFF